MRKHIFLLTAVILVMTFVWAIAGNKPPITTQENTTTSFGQITVKIETSTHVTWKMRSIPTPDDIMLLSEGKLLDPVHHFVVETLEFEAPYSEGEFNQLIDALYTWGFELFSGECETLSNCGSAAKRKCGVIPGTNDPDVISLSYAPMKECFFQCKSKPEAYYYICAEKPITPAAPGN